MKRFLLIALIIAGGLLWVQSARLRSEKRERRRLESNQTALMSDVEIYRTKAGKDNSQHTLKKSQTPLST